MAEPKTCNFHESLSVFELDLATWKQRDTWYFNLYTVLKTICSPCYKLLRLLDEYFKTADEQTLSFDEDLSSPWYVSVTVNFPSLDSLIRAQLGNHEFDTSCSLAPTNFEDHKEGFQLLVQHAIAIFSICPKGRRSGTREGDWSRITIGLDLGNLSHRL